MRVTKYFETFMRKNKNADEHWCTYMFFVVLRLVLVFIPQLGYVHPDEFFQSTEIFIGEHFQLEHIRSWEFNSTFPLRSVAVSLITLKIPLNLLEIIAVNLRGFFGIDIICSYTYLVFPRLVMCILSFVNDWSLYKVCQLYSLRYEIRLLALGSSHVMLIFGTRTFSNSIEMAISSVLLYLVAECMIHSNTVIYKKEFLEERYEKADSIGERVKIWKLKNALPPHNYNRLLLMSTLCVAGVFNRPTFLLFGAPMVFYWMLRGMGTKSVSFKHFNLRMALFCLSAVPATLLFTIIDSFYYKYLTMGELHMVQIGINNFVFTPWNFIKYNIDPTKTAQHGLHPRYIHLLVNIPLLYNILGVIALVAFGQQMLRFFKAEYQGLPRAQSIVGLMSAAIFAPVFFMSLINHQEARFLIPFTFPIVLLHSPKLVTGFCTSYPFKEEHPFLRFVYEKFLCSRASARYLLKTWYTLNIALVIFFGFIHQSGVFPLAQHFETSMQTKAPNENLHLITSHVYSFPLSFVNIPSSGLVRVNRHTGQKYRHRKDFYLYEYGSTDLSKLILKLKIILNHCETKQQTQKLKYRLYLAIPASLTDQLHEVAYKSNMTSIDYELIKVFYPHLSTEALPNPFGRHPCDLNTPIDDLKGTCQVPASFQAKDDFLSMAYLSRQFSAFAHQFGLALYKFEIKHNKRIY
ncbi:GPI mannosyltransferase 4 [Eupeodes corollae]|uniref:GPI mannosyltransferase 4 n=1 Tax=Eupeodes corollae TaxID=290404 RepID=UPI00248F880E|nr:GPI mannosyltransferase 4 [Eupeodes corollae]